MIATDPRVAELLEWSFDVFSSLDASEKYHIAFSGGKDSHAVLGAYNAWTEHTGKSLGIEVAFSDTLLEASSLISAIDNCSQACEQRGITFHRFIPPVHKRFWSLLVGLGYPVPNYRNRWCTQYLKINQMKALKRIGITGSHYGESENRNKRLNSCGSSECGIDRINNTVEPIARWRNCHVWDFLMLDGDRYLYPGVFNLLSDAYGATESDSSLRMGCFMCPVIAVTRIQGQVENGVVPPIAMTVRMLIEWLRIQPRINSKRTGKAGAIWIEARRFFWDELEPLIPELLSMGWIDCEQIAYVKACLEKGAYPPTYGDQWIREQHQILGASGKQIIQVSEVHSCS